MGVTSEILIYTPKHQTCFITEETIKGIVKYHLDKDTEYKNIALSLVARGKCKWKSGKTWYSGREKILVEKIYLLNNNTDDENITLSAGSYEYPFEIMIPENIPPSVITSIGEIKYNLVLKFKSTSSFSRDQTFKKRIVIFPRIDSSISDEPVVAKLDKNLFKPFSSKAHEIHLEAVLDKGHMTPRGERNISFNVINKSDIIFTIKTQLVSKTKYKADFIGKLTKTKKIHSCTVQTPEIPDNSESNMFNIIPVAPEIYTVRHSEMMKREYYFRVTLKLPMPHANSSVDLPVFVGAPPITYGEEAGEAIGEPGDEKPPPQWEAMKEGKNDDD